MRERVGETETDREARGEREKEGEGESEKETERQRRTRRSTPGRSNATVCTSFCMFGCMPT